MVAVVSGSGLGLFNSSILGGGGTLGSGAQGRGLGSNPQCDAVIQRVSEVLAREVVFTFACRAAPPRDELAELAVRALRGGEEHDSIAFRKSKLGADDELEPAFLPGFVCLDNPRERALIRDRDRRVADVLRSVHQLLRVWRRPAER